MPNGYAYKIGRYENVDVDEGARRSVSHMKRRVKIGRDVVDTLRVVVSCCLLSLFFLFCHLFLTL